MREHAREVDSHAPRGGKLPFSAAPRQRELLERLGDEPRMGALLERELSRLAEAEVRVPRLSAKPSKSRRSIRAGRIDVVYRAEIEIDGQPSVERVLLGIAPAPPELTGAALEERGRALRDHPWAAPLRGLTAFVDELRLALLVFPLDPALPGLAELTGSAGARLLARTLPECRAGAEVQGIECELAHYKPFDWAVLRVVATLRGPRGSAERTVYAKLFADDHGASCFQELTALWAASRNATALRLPEPLGYDAERRMLVMAEAPGERALTEWIKRLEHGDPLPAGVDPARLERCAVVAARALRELQAAPVRPELRRTFRFELARVKKDRDLLLGGLRSARPELAARTDALLARLEALAPRRERLAPAHGGYRHKQMIGDEHSLTLIDWDGISLASPALDAATFLGRLEREPRRRPGAAPELARMAGAFRRAFLEGRPALARDLDLYESLVLTEQVLRALRRPGDERETAEEVRSLAAAATALLDRVQGG
jgi:hypothetical protein